MDDPHDVLLVCAICGRIRRSDGTWAVPEDEDSEILAEVDLSHGLCAGCRERHYKGFEDT